MPSPWPSPRGRGVLVGVLLVHAGLLAYSASIHSPVIDEPAHLAAGLSHWRFGEFSLYRVNPPLVRMIATAPLLATSIETDWAKYSHDPNQRLEVVVGHDLVRANGSRIFRYVTIARWACIPFSLIGAIVGYQWARLLFGKPAGLLAAALWCFSPTILGHGSLMTPDVAATAVGLGACYTFFRWLVAPRFGRSVLAGVVLGAAEGCKSTWIILFAIYPCIWLLFRISRARAKAKPSILQLAAILALGWWLLVSMYAWQGVGAPAGTLHLHSNLLRRVLGEPTSDGEYRVRPALAKLPLPLPRDYVLGLDQQWRDLEGPNRSFLRGQWRDYGWWYYYSYGLAVKEPVGVLALATFSAMFWCGVGCVQALRKQFSQRRLFLVATSGLVALCPLNVFLIASANTGMNHHVRYVMPVVPFLYILAAGLMTRCGPWRTGRMIVSHVFVAYVVVSSLLTYPHSLSYFNEIAGGPAGGIRHLNNSNVDWGQDLLLLRQWKKEHAPSEPIHLAYFGRVNPTYADIDYRLPPRLSPSMSDVERQKSVRELEPGWYAVSVTLLQGRSYIVPTPEGSWMGTEEDAFAYFREMRQTDRVGYSIYIYRVTPK